MKLPVETPIGQMTLEVVVVDKQSNEVVFLGHRYSYEYVATATVVVAVGITAGIMTRPLVGATIALGGLFVANQIFKPAEL